MSSAASSQIAAGDRFAFGENWARFLDLLDPERIAAAEASLRTRLDVAATDDLTGRSFIDIGSGSGLFSLAARNLGATVHSFDFDPESVACTAELRRRYHPGDPGWTVEQGSALDTGYLDKLGDFDIVYSWGVLHHTGAMWDALANVAPLVAPGGRLFIAIYNDQGQASNRWARVKQRYNRSGPGQRPANHAGVRAYPAAKPQPTRTNGLCDGQPPAERHASPRPTRPRPAAWTATATSSTGSAAGRSRSPRPRPSSTSTATAASPSSTC